MLPEEDEHGIVEHMDIAKGGLLRALSLVMEDADGEVPVLPSCLQESVGEVCLRP